MDLRGGEREHELSLDCEICGVVHQLNPNFPLEGIGGLFGSELVLLSFRPWVLRTSRQEVDHILMLRFSLLTSGSACRNGRMIWQFARIVCCLDTFPSSGKITISICARLFFYTSAYPSTQLVKYTLRCI